VNVLGRLGACWTWGVESENRAQRGQFLPDLQTHSPAMGQKDGEKWTAAVDLQPTIPKSDRLLGYAALLLMLLAGCTTAPPSPAPSPDRALASPSTRPPLVPLSPEEAGSSAMAPTIEASPADEQLLAGEAVHAFEQGGASWYGPRFHGRRTASGERYDMHALTAAHKTLPFGTMVRVRSLVNGKEVDVRITDRGPFSRGRVIDLSRAAAEAIGMLGLGVKDVLLLVPASTPLMAETPPPLIKRPRLVRPALAPRPR